MRQETIQINYARNGETTKIITNYNELHHGATSRIIGALKGN